METVDVLMKMPKVDGYEYTGEYRVPRMGETHWSPVSRDVYKCGCDGLVARAILRKAEVWKPLTLDKAVEFMASRTPVTMRYVNWAPGRKRTDTITSIYMHTGLHPAIDLEGRGNTAHLSNVQYLET